MISVLVLLGLLENCVVFIFFLEIFAKFGYSFFVIMLNVGLFGCIQNWHRI